MSYNRFPTSIFLVLALVATARSQSTPQLAVSAPLHSGFSPANVNPPTAPVVHVTGIPQLSSALGAAYTLYLDFGGFNFTGTWGGSGDTPGTVAAFDNVSGSFNSILFGSEFAEAGLRETIADWGTNQR